MHVTDVTANRALPMRTLEQYQEWVVADCKVLIAGPAVEPMTERERLLLEHATALMHAPLLNSIMRNIELAALLSQYRDREEEEPPGMSVCA